ncbi:MULTISPECIES: DUF4232 domain-containing protein [unclassified Streptomyces]|uniref:DUF4232 domain-containing protein n=1 Tax=unclassified Streptomyces TaxID=2593676 RepID=UPI00344DB994
MRVHKVTFAVLAVAASLSLTACQSTDAAAGKSDPSSAPSSSSSDARPSSGDTAPAGGAEADGAGSAGTDQDGGSGTGGSTAGGTASGGTSSGKKSSGGTGAGSGSDAKATAPKCTTGDLRITASDSTIDGDREGTVAVELTNRGGRTCVVSGWAGVDLRTSAGTLSAKRSGEKAGPVTLKSGASIPFGVHYPLNESGGSGIRVTGLVVTPPNETTPVTLAWPGAATLPVTEGGGSPVRVGPLGGIGQGG